MTRWSLILLIPGSSWQMQENSSQTAASDSHCTHQTIKRTGSVSQGLSFLRTVALWRKRGRLIIDSTVFRSCLYFWSDLRCVAFERITDPVCSDCECFCFDSQILESVSSPAPFSWTCQLLHIALSADELYLSLSRFRWAPLPCIAGLSRLLSLLSVKRADLLAQFVEWAVGDVAGLRSERRVESRDEKSSGCACWVGEKVKYQTGSVSEIPSLTCTNKRQREI